MSKPTLSVVVPNFNDAHCISEALEAILAQSFRPVEVIVIDDGSTDSSIAVIEEFRRRDPIVRLLRNERNMGSIFSLNRGLREACGDYVYFPGADDKVLPGLFEKSMRLLERYPQAGVCAALVQVVTEKGKDVRVGHGFVLISRTECFLPPAKALAAYRRHGPMWHGVITSIFRRDALIDGGGFLPEVGSYCDAFMFQVLAVKHGACYIPEPLGVFKVVDNSWGSLAGSSEVFLAYRKGAVQLMRSNYRNVFPEQYVQEFWKENLCIAGLLVDGKLQAHHGECLADLKRSLEESKFTDRLFLSVLRFSTAIEYLFVALYLHLRLRRFAWPRLVNILRLLLSQRFGQVRPQGLTDAGLSCQHGNRTKL